MNENDHPAEPTWYDGYLYRSKLEAYTAAYLHINFLDYDNENCFQLSNGEYFMPDFRISAAYRDFFIEAKGDHQWTEDGMRKVECFSDDEPIIVFGKKWPRSSIDLQNQHSLDNRFFSDKYIDGFDGDCCVIIGCLPTGGVYVPISALDDQEIHALDCALDIAYKHINGLREQDPAEKIKLTEAEQECVYPLWNCADNILDSLGWREENEEVEPMETQAVTDISQEEKEKCMAIINDYLKRTGISAQDFARRFFPENANQNTIASVMSTIRRGTAASTREHLYKEMADYIQQNDHFQIAVQEINECDQEKQVVKRPRLNFHDRVRSDSTMFQKLDTLLSVYDISVDDLAIWLLSKHVQEQSDFINTIEEMRGAFHGF